VIIADDPIEKEDVIEVTLTRNGEEVHLSGVTKKNPYTLTFRVPDVYLGVTSLVTIKLIKNGTDLGTKQLKCESQLHTLEYALKHCDQPLDFTCQASRSAVTYIIDFSNGMLYRIIFSIEN